MDEFTHIDLFSGIGGFALAAQACGFKTVLFCEIDEFCQKVLQARFRGVVADSKSTRWPTWASKGEFRGCNSAIPIIPDIRDIDGTEWRGATLLTGGFPCQPFSQAGQRRGKEDDRYLWPEMLRVIKEASPHWVLAENVSGIVKMALDEVLTDLESEGYSTGPVIIPACAKNAPHRRDRVWIVAHCERGKSWESPEQEGREDISRRDKESGDAPNSKLARGEWGDTDKMVRQENWREVLWSKRGIGDWSTSWLEVATRFCRMDDGLPSWVYSDRVKRLKALGNAIVPQVAQEIIKCIYNIEVKND